MSCPKCEEARLAGKKYCTQCGTRLFADEPAVVPEPEQPAEPQPERSQWSGVYHEPDAAPEPERSQWTGVAAPPPEPQPEPQPEPVHTYTPPESTGTYTVPTPEVPKKKKNVGAIAAITALIALIAAAAVLFATGVISFGGDKDKDDEKDDPEPTASVAPSEEPSPEPSEEPEDKGVYTIGETVLADNDICRVTLNKASEDDDMVYFEMKLENTSDDPYAIFVGVDAFNEYELRDYGFSVRADLDGGGTATKTLKVDKQTLDIYGIDQLDKVTFNVYATEDPDADEVVYAVDEYIDTYPTGMSAKRFSRPSRASIDPEEIVYDTNDVLFMIGNPGVDSDNDYSFIVYAENDNSERVMFAMDDITINGVSYGDYFVSACGGGHAMYELFWFTEAELAELGLAPEDVQTVTFTFTVYDWDTMDELDSFSYTIGG